jgi:hypothetical protein
MLIGLALNVMYVRKVMRLLRNLVQFENMLIADSKSDA